MGVVAPGEKKSRKTSNGNGSQWVQHVVSVGTESAKENFLVKTGELT